MVDDTTVAAAILDRLPHHSAVVSITVGRYRIRALHDAIASLRPAVTDGDFGDPCTGFEVAGINDGCMVSF
jgi:hypothetical protein